MGRRRIRKTSLWILSTASDQIMNLFVSRTSNRISLSLRSLNDPAPFLQSSLMQHVPAEIVRPSVLLPSSLSFVNHHRPSRIVSTFDFTANQRLVIAILLYSFLVTLISWLQHHFSVYTCINLNIWMFKKQSINGKNPNNSLSVVVSLFFWLLFVVQHLTRWFRQNAN